MEVGEFFSKSSTYGDCDLCVLMAYVFEACILLFISIAIFSILLLTLKQESSLIFLIKVINHLHSNRRKTSIFYFSQKPKMSYRIPSNLLRPLISANGPFFEN